MNARQFTIVVIRILGLVSVVVGLILTMSVGILRSMGTLPPQSTSISDLPLHDTYYIVSHIEDAWTVPGVVCVLLGAILIGLSGRLGRWFTRDLES